MRVALQALLISLVVNLGLRAVALLTLDIPSEFSPLQTPGPVIVLTSVGVIAAVGVFALLRRFSSQPIQLFRRIAAVALVVSFVPDFWLLTEGAAGAFPGATVAGVATLIAQHIATAAIVVWALTMRGQKTNVA